MSRKIWFVTENKGKVASFQRHLEPLAVTVVSLKTGHLEVQVDSVLEVAQHKVRQAYGDLEKPLPLVALDAGLFIPELDGFPGAYTKYVLGKIGLEGILRLIRGRDRSCQLQHVVSYVSRSVEHRPGSPAVTSVDFETAIQGTLAEEGRGELQSWHWSALSRIFIPLGHKQTLAEMTKDEYQNFSREYSPTRKFADWLKSDPRRLDDLEVE